MTSENAKKHVAVLMGGFSSERPVSLASGKPCADALEAAECWQLALERADGQKTGGDQGGRGPV